MCKPCSQRPRCSAPSRPCLPATVPVQCPSTDSAHPATPRAQRRLRAVTTTLGAKGAKGPGHVRGSARRRVRSAWKAELSAGGKRFSLPQAFFEKPIWELKSHACTPSLQRAFSTVEAGPPFPPPRREAPGPHGVSAQRKGRARNLGGAAPSKGSFLSLGVKSDAWFGTQTPTSIGIAFPLQGLQGWEGEQ